jgi:hypothetical protein
VSAIADARMTVGPRCAPSFDGNRHEETAIDLTWERPLFGVMQSFSKVESKQPPFHV